MPHFQSDLPIVTQKVSSSSCKISLECFDMANYPGQILIITDFSWSALGGVAGVNCPFNFDINNSLLYIQSALTNYAFVAQNETHPDHRSEDDCGAEFSDRWFLHIDDRCPSPGLSTAKSVTLVGGRPENSQVPNVRMPHTSVVCWWWGFLFLAESRRRKQERGNRSRRHIENQFWLVAEHGMKAGYVRNMESNPRVRLGLRDGLRTRWHTGTAYLLRDDDPRERQCWLASQLPSSTANAGQCSSWNRTPHPSD